MEKDFADKDVLTLSHEDERLLEIGKSVLVQEARELTNASSRFGLEMIEAAKLIFECKGPRCRLWFRKSGIIAKKIAATFASLGTPRFSSMQPRECMAIWEWYAAEI